MLRFDVFGRLVGGERKNGSWQVYLGSEGKRLSARDLIVPPDLPESALAQAFARSRPRTRHTRPSKRYSVEGIDRVPANQRLLLPGP